MAFPASSLGPHVVLPLEVVGELLLADGDVASEVRQLAHDGDGEDAARCAAKEIACAGTRWREMIGHEARKKTACIRPGLRSQET